MFIETAPTWTLLLKNLSSFFGRQPLPPKWLYNGAVLGLQGGTEKVKLFYVIFYNFCSSKLKQNKLISFF